MLKQLAKYFLITTVLVFSFKSFSQGNRLSIQCSPPKKLSICGINDTTNVQVFNITGSSVNSVNVVLNLPPGVLYVAGTVLGSGISESNITNLNQPVFNAPNIGVAQNIKLRVTLTSNCDLLQYLNSSNVPNIGVRVNYFGNFDLGSSIPFSVNVPSAQFSSISNSSFVGDINSKFERKITIGNYGKGPLKELVLKRINGKDIQIYKVNGGQNVFTVDTIYTFLNSSHFVKIGNKDSLLDQNETIEIIDSLLIKGCKSLNTNYELYWGCNKKICIVSKASNSASISNKIPNLKAITFPSFPTCYNNNRHQSELRLTNIGAMTAFANKVSINQYYTLMSRLDTTTLRIKMGYKGSWFLPQIDSIVYGYSVGEYACLGVNPITFFRIKTPDLKPGDTLFIKWETFSCMPSRCTNQSYNYNSWLYNASYQDQCKNILQLPLAWGRTYDQHYLALSTFAPSDMVNNQVAEFRSLISSASVLRKTTSAEFIVDLILPSGLIHSKLKKDFYFINADLTTQWNPDSIIQKGDTFRAYFPQNIPISLVNAELVYYLKADCSKSGANGMKNIQLQFKYSPDKSCSKREWFYLTCQTFQLKLHCYSNCNGGMVFNNFSVQRINYGLPDSNNDGLPDNNGILDTSKIREERTLFGDTIMSTFTGIVKRTSSITSWRHLFVESNITYGSYLTLLNAEITVFRGGINRLNCIRTTNSKVVSGQNARFKVDLSLDSLGSCLPFNFRLINGDSVVVDIKYKVSGNIGGTAVIQNFNNLFYLSNVSNPTSNANKFQCDTFSGKTILTGYYYANYGRNDYNVNTCNVIGVSNNYYLGIGPCCSNYGGNNYFPYEYRSFSRLKAIRLHLPQGYKYKYSYLNQYRTAGSNKTATEIKDTIKPLNMNSNPLVFELSKHYKDSVGGVFNYSDDGYHGVYIAYIEPTCEIPTTGQQNIKYDFIFEKRNSFGVGFDTLKSGAQDDYIKYNKPVVSIKPLSQTIYAAQDTAEWEINYTNLSTSFSNLNTWFAPDNSGAVKVVSIKDANKDTLMPVINGIYKLGTIGFNNTRKFKIRSIYNTCNKDSVIIYSGWNCGGYPTDINNFNCQKERIALYIEPQNTQFQVGIIDSTTTADLCAQTPYKYILENIGSTTAYNTKAILTLPIGMNIVSGSCYIQYPHKNSRLSISNPTLVSGTTYEWNLAAINNTINSNGFKGVSDTNRNKIIIHFKVQTDCDYSSGNYIRAGAKGNIKCGNSIIAYPGISNPLNIKGVTRPYFTLVKVDIDSILPCEKSTQVKVRIINLGPDKSGIEDKYQAILLKGMYYDTSSYNGIYNAPNGSLNKYRNINGATEVEFSLKSGVVPGDSMEFTFNFGSDGSYLNCGSQDFYSQAAVKQEVVCVADNSLCNINVITGNSLQKPNVYKGSLSLENLKTSLQSVSSDSEVLNLKFDIKNKGNNISYSQAIVYKIINDVNQSGTADINDLVVFTDTINKSLLKNDVWAINQSIVVKAGVSCDLFVVIDSSSCSCDFNYAKFPVPILRNAGQDFQICSEQKTKLGINSTKGFSYSWLPILNIDNDKISNPSFIANHDDTGILKMSYVLSTNRGTCSSKDTVNVLVYNLPKIRMNQKDTTVCENKKVRLFASTFQGNGKHALLWKPYQFLSDSNKNQVIAFNAISNTYKLFVEDDKGCKAIDSIKITVKNNPKANFYYNKNCQGNDLLLMDSSIVLNDNITYNRWTSSVSDTINASQWLFDMQGQLNQTIQLVARTTFGCLDTFIKTVSAHPKPIAQFSVDNICFSDTVHAVNLSSIFSGQIVENIWEAGDGNSSTNKNFNHLYTKSDTFNIGLIVKSDQNCSDTFFKSVVVFPKPNVDFSVNAVCLGDSSLFDNQSTILLDSINAYIWSLENNFFTSKNHQYLFAKDTQYSIKLVVSSSHYCKDSVTKTTDVYPNPIANFKADPVCEKTNSEITNLSSITKDSISNWHYQISDGSNYTNRSFTHLFNSGDTFQIRLITESIRGCRDTIQKNHIVYPRIDVDFAFKDHCFDDSLRLNDLSSFYQTNIAEWKWIFNQEDSSTLQNPNYRFKKWGLNYPISLKVNSIENCKYAIQKTVNVYPLPKVDFKDTNQCVDNQFNFTNLSTIELGSIINFNWDFDDQSISNQINPYHRFPRAGDFYVKLIAQSNQSCKDSIIKLIKSYPPVVVDFNFANVCIENPVQFLDNSSTPYAQISQHNWQLGDMATSALKNPIHLYKIPGIYKVKYQITTDYNCIYDTTKNVEVYPKPSAVLQVNPEVSTILNPEITITDLSIGADSLWYNLGDGTFTNQRNLIHLYPDSGYYEIKQYARNNYGCNDSVTKTIQIKYLFVFNAPTAFSPNNDGVNDLYQPEGIGTKHYEMRIFNRWGELIYVTQDSKGWDGTYQGKMVQDGVYSAVFKVKDFKNRYHYLKTSFVLLN
ncbi:MAG: PKD domain-containing protein [Bacteroidota bacterium]|nr:PKD domain-containing protein [Bacteroidota bacterium]